MEDYYFGKEEYEKYGELVLKNLAGKTISKRICDADQPGGLTYEAKKLNMEWDDLLCTLEGLCHNEKAIELYPGDSYKIKERNNDNEKI